MRGGIGWLTLRRGLTILGLIAVCVVAPLIWVTLLRRTVRQQTGIIRARLESELRLETKYRRLFERNLAAVFSWRPDGTIVDCNLAFARMLGFESREQLIGRSYWDFQVDPAHRERVVRRAATRGGVEQSGGKPAPGRWRHGASAEEHHARPHRGGNGLRNDRHRCDAAPAESGRTADEPGTRPSSSRSTIL